MKTKEIIWKQEYVFLDNKYKMQYIGFYGYVKGKEEYFLGILWTFEAMNNCIDVCIKNMCKKIKENL